MNCEDTTGLLPDRLKGLISAEDERRLDAHLAACHACREEADAVTALWADMDDATDRPVPHERMRARFYAALSAYETRAADAGLAGFLGRIWPTRPALQAAVAVALLIVGLAAGLSLPSSTDREIAALREEIRTVGLVLLDHQSASERLRGVAWSRQVTSDSRAVEALLDTVRHDANLNVRLAAVEALSQWLDRPQVGAGLTDALERQESPLMQVTLAQVLLEGDVDGSTAAVRRMLERETLDPSVRDYLRMTLLETGAGPAIPDLL